MLIEIFLYFLYLLLAYIYPFYISLTITSKDNVKLTNNEEYVKWISYWILLALINIFIFPILNLIFETLPDNFWAINILVKLGIIVILNLPPFNMCLIIYQRFVYGEEEIEIIRYNLRKYGRILVDFIENNE